MSEGRRPYLLDDVTPWTVSLADVGAALLQTLVEGVAVKLTDVAVLLVLLKIRLVV